MPTAIKPDKPPLPNPETRFWILATTFPKKDMLVPPTNSCTAIANANSATASSVKEPTAPFIVLINYI